VDQGIGHVFKPQHLPLQKKSSTSFNDQSSDTRNTRNVPQHNKGYIWQAYSQHHTKWGKLKPFPLKSRMRQECSFFTLIQHSLGIPSQNSKIGRRNKRNTNWKRSSQTIPIYRQNDLITKRSEKFHQKLLDTINSFNKVAECKIILQKSTAFLYTNSEQIEK
jgi:hypothetical protein